MHTSYSYVVYRWVRGPRVVLVSLISSGFILRATGNLPSTSFRQIVPECLHDGVISPCRVSRVQEDSDGNVSSATVIT